MRLTFHDAAPRDNFGAEMRDDPSDKSAPGSSAAPTEGAGQPPQMEHTLLGRYPVAGSRYVFWLEASPGGMHLYRRDMQADATQLPVHVDGFTTTPDSYIWSDQTAVDFRVWRIGRDQLQLNSPGIQAGRSAARAVADRTRQIAAINDRHAAVWR